MMRLPVHIWDKHSTVWAIVNNNNNFKKFTIIINYI